MPSGPSAPRGDTARFEGWSFVAGIAMSFASRRPSSLVPTRLAIALALALGAGAAFADVNPQADVPPPQDTPYPGTITLNVDASDTSQGIFSAHETIPVQAGELT